MSDSKTKSFAALDHDKNSLSIGSTESTNRCYLSYPVRFGSYSFTPLPEPVYCDIVRKDDFRPDSEAIRSLRTSPGSAAGSTPQYDYDHPVSFASGNLKSEVELLVRSGKLDKADIQTLEAAIKKDYADAKATEENAEAAKKKADIEALRQANTDKLLGFEPESVSKGGSDE